MYISRDAWFIIQARENTSDAEFLFFQRHLWLLLKVFTHILFLFPQDKE